MATSNYITRAASGLQSFLINAQLSLSDNSESTHPAKMKSWKCSVA